MYIDIGRKYPDKFIRDMLLHRLCNYGL